MAEALDLDEVGRGSNGCAHVRLRLVGEAIEGVLTSGAVLSALSTAIDAVTEPEVTLTAQQKRRAVLMWARQQLEASS